MRGVLILAAALGAWSPPLPAQEAEPPPRVAVQSPVLTLDVERLFAETRFGRRIEADLRQRGEALQRENEALAAELTARERSLTERRASMEPEAFRAEADAFDREVQRIRAEQDAKEAALRDAAAEGRQTFLNEAMPILARLMVASGAAVILERRSVFLGAGVVDITDEAIAAIDAALGDGTAVAPDDPAPDAPTPDNPTPDGPPVGEDSVPSP
ncbi:OmpH family outer membrane protein [Rubellimicrobium sp. CFH 75288]|uniref:OmpH family outer membrane protein n=1 Tax=Rubellimicrobium sp. CFH 75288 TaxID=2697034 RepID=UPI0014132BD9|nr:OmpH family outer membrane protein [Rubellimicrobium sp. CFH 75288]NAZ36967.1 OmpH family outer membrane protein [Rubellimicrobium sp. CFH 75288]